MIMRLWFHGGSDAAAVPLQVGRLKRQDQANEESNQGKNRQASDADLHGLRYCALEAQRLSLKRGHQSVISRAGAKRREGTEITQAIEGAAAELRDEFHIRKPSPVLRCRKLKRP